MVRLMFLTWCAFLWVINCRASDISYLERGSILEKDIAAIFNKVAYGGVTTTKRSISSKYLPVSGTLTTLPPPVTSILVPSTTPLTSDTPRSSANTNFKPENKTERARHRQDLTSTHTRNQNVQYTTNLPPFVAPKTSFPISYTTPSSRGEIPSYIPPVRLFFTPPLPPEHANPFADKPTLRGSNSDTSITNVRRPLPPPRPSHEIYGRERIPLRPPVLGPEVNVGSSNPERKKPLNTPSFNRSPDAPSYDNIEHETPSSKPQNDTDFDFVPINNYPSVSRILSGSNGRKDFPDIRKPHIESRLPPRMPEHFPNVNLESIIPSNSNPPRPVELPPRGPETPQIGVRNSDPIRTPARSNVDYDGRTSKDEKSSSGGLPDSIDVESKVDSIVSGSVPENNRAEKLPDPQPQPPELTDSDSNINLSNKNLEFKPSRKNTNGSWLLAWDIHVYLIATLFLLLAICSLINLIRINSYKRLLSHGYYISVHSFLLIIGTLRSLYLFLDAYNMKGLLPKPFSDLILNIVSPMITSTFLILFLFILKASKVDLLTPRLQHPLGIAIFIVFHIFLCISFELTSEIQPELHILPLISQCIYIIILVIIGVIYLYIYKVLAKSVVRKSENIFGGNFTNIYKPTIAVTIRTSLATALLALLMAAIQLYGIFGILDSWKLEGGSRKLQWLWWGYQFSVRFIEIAMCFLMLWAGIQSLRCHSSNDDEKNSDNSGFALFRCGQCTNTGQNSEANDDIYPAVCVTNQAIHDYTLRTGKKVYDDSFPLNSLHSQIHPNMQNTLGTTIIQREASPSLHYEEPNVSLTSDRRSLKKTYQSQDNYAGNRSLASNNYALYEEHGALATDGGYQQGNRFKYDDSNFSTNERRSIKKVSPSYDSDDFNGQSAGLGKSGSFIDMNQRYKGDKRPMKKSGTFENAELERHGPPIKSSTVERRSSKTKNGDFHPGDVRGSLKKSSERRAVNPHRSGAQTLNTPRDRNSPSSSMLVAENGFVRFRALQEPEELDSDEGLMER